MVSIILYAKLKNLKVQKGDIISEKQVIADLVQIMMELHNYNFKYGKIILS